MLVLLTTVFTIIVNVIVLQNYHTEVIDPNESAEEVSNRRVSFDSSESVDEQLYAFGVVLLFLWIMMFIFHVLNWSWLRARIAYASISGTRKRGSLNSEPSNDMFQVCVKSIIMIVGLKQRQKKSLLGCNKGCTH